MQQPVVFHVSNDWFDGIASFQLAPDAASYTALLSCFEYFNISYVVTAITEIDITSLGTLSRQSLYLLQCGRECVTIVGIAWQ